MRFDFDSQERREEIHNYIREAASLINENNELLQTLFMLENGNHRHTGFGYIKNNTPESSVVRFNCEDIDFEEEVLEKLQNASAEDLGADEDKEATDIAENLSEVASALREEYK